MIADKVTSCYKSIVVIFLLKICLKGRVTEGEQEEEIEKNLTYIDVFIKWLQQPGLRQAETENLRLHLCHPCRWQGLNC